MEGIENDKRDSLGLTQEDLETLFEGTFEQVSEKHSKKPQNNNQNTPFFGANSDPNFMPNSFKKTDHSKDEKFKPVVDSERSKSSLRLKYEAEVNVIKKTHGDLEKIRRLLGLSKRKVSQLLLVDPSAWTRWTSKKADAPPHIYRALQWYMILQDKHPELKSSVWLNAVAQPQLSQHEIDNIKKTVVEKAQSEIGEQRGRNLLQIDDLKRELKQQSIESKKQLESLNKKFIWTTAFQGFVILTLVVFLML